jgi:hypothetical protein
MASYHIDPFRRFITGEPFQSNYNLDSGLVEKLNTDQAEVIEFGHKFLKQVLFGEKMFDEKEGAEGALVKRMKEKSELVKKAAEQRAEDFPRKQKGGKT